MLKKRREVLPLDMPTPEGTAAAAGEEVSKLPLQREEESCLSNLKENAVQWEQHASSCQQPASLSPHKSLRLDTQPKKEKKCVKLVDSPARSEALHEQSGNTPGSPRSVSLCLAASSLPRLSFLAACTISCGSLCPQNYVPWSSEAWALCAWSSVV